jgi:hypothetical protein
VLLKRFPVGSSCTAREFLEMYLSFCGGMKCCGYYHNPFEYAIQSQKLEFVKAFLNCQPFSMSYYAWRRILLSCASTAHYEMLKIILEKDNKVAEFCSKNYDEEDHRETLCTVLTDLIARLLSIHCYTLSPKELAATRALDCVDLLIDTGKVEINSFNCDGLTPLMVICSNASAPRSYVLSLMEKVVNLGADINMVSRPQTRGQHLSSPLRFCYDASFEQGMRYLVNLPSFILFAEELVEMRNISLTNLDGFSSGWFEEKEEASSREFLFELIEEKILKNFQEGMPNLDHNVHTLIFSYLFKLESLKFSRVQEETESLFG